MIRALVIGIWATASVVQAAETANQMMRSGIAEFHAAFQAWDGVRFGKAAHRFKQAAEKSPNSATPRYWQGTALFHRMLEAQSRPKPDANAADAAMENAIHALEAAISLDPAHAESHALLGTLYGMKIHGGILNAIRFGPRVQNHQKLALRSGGHNPRVLYLLGAGRFHTAKTRAAYRQALHTLLDAEKLFIAEAKRPPKPLEPRWGLSSCRKFTGLTYLKLGDEKHAVAYFRKALADHPNDHIAARELAKFSSHPSDS